MTNPKCTVCGHVNRVGAAVCEMCDTRLGEPARVGADDPSRAAGESSDSYSGSYSGPSAGDFGASAAGFEPDGEETRVGALPTDIPSPQFQGAGDVMSPTLEVYRKHFLLVGLLVLVTTLPLAVLQYAAVAVVSTGVLESEGRGGSGLDVLALTMGGLGAVLYWLLMMLGNALLSGALAYAVISIQRTGTARAGESLRWGLGKMLKIFTLTLLVALLIYLLPVVLVTLLAFVIGPLAFVGYLLLLLPWVILTLTFSLAMPAVAVENSGVIDSLRRSAELTKGFKGLIFLTYFLWWVVIVVLNLIVSGSFSFGGASDTLPALVVQTVVGGMLNSSMTVLTIYIFLGILNERRQRFATRAFTPGPGEAAR